jgi:hypothetical protein
VQTNSIDRFSFSNFKTFFFFLFLLLFEQAPNQLLIRPPTILHFNQLESSRLGLVFQTRPSDFVNGQLRLRCAASILLSYRFEASQELEGSKSKGEPTRILHGPNSSSGKRHIPIHFFLSLFFL